MSEEKIICKKCMKEIGADFMFCPFCGRSTPNKPRSKHRRANGEGTIIKRGQSYSIRITTEWKDGVQKYKEKGGFKTQAAAKEYKATLEQAALNKRESTVRGIDYSNIGFEELYTKMMERDKKRISEDTLYCYRAAHKYFADIVHMRFRDLNTEDYQICIDDCPRGIQTKKNMKALGTKMYKYAAELRVFGINTQTDFARLVWIEPQETESRLPFDKPAIDKLKIAVANNVPYADYILAMCYSGFRPSEFLALKHDSYDPTKNILIGGAKTEAGKNRVVPVHPLIKKIVAEKWLSGSAYLFGNGSEPFTLDNFRPKYFYPALENAGIQGIPREGEKPRWTPYSCRHTFATMMKSVQGSPKDKAALMGHTSFEMTLHYQHEDYESLSNIIQQIV